MPDLPTGTVTFLFTDIEGSTRLWEEHPGAMQAALARHDTLLRQAIESHGGHVFKTMGDQFCAAFATASEAGTAARDAQCALHAEAWGGVGPLRVRMALHTGVAQVRDGDYFGPPLNRVARLLDAGHGGQTLLSQATADLLRDALPEGTALRDLGAHRLKDLQQPEHIFQLLHPDLPQEFRPLVTLDLRPNNLPAPPTPLLGRVQELEAVCALLRREAVRLVTLTGPGGTGKTRLGLQIAAELLQDFPDGVFFVDLAPISDPGLVASRIAQALEVRETGGQSLLESLKQYLRPMQLLLLLDNFEQVLPAAPVVAELLAAAPRVNMLVTSRALLHVRGEHEWPVPPLAPHPAVELFAQRVLALQPEFAVTQQNAAVVAEICHRLEGLPLAIELAAARIKLFPPPALLARMERRLPLLTGGARDLPARQQTLRGTIAWSYDLLQEAEKKLFRRLSVFVGGCTLETAEAVCSGEAPLDVLEGVEALVSQSLLRQEAQPDGEPRLTMLETVREFGRECLAASPEEGAIRQQHARFFLALAEAAEPELHRGNQVQWLDRLEAEHDNLRAALAWYQATDDAEAGLRLAGALAWLWLKRNYFAEGRQWLEQALSRGSGAPAALRVKALQALGIIYRFCGEPEASRSALEESLALAREAGDSRATAYSLLQLGIQASWGNDGARAKMLGEECLALAREVGDPWLLAHPLHLLGMVASQQGDFREAIRLFEESLRLTRGVGDKFHMGMTLGFLAIQMGYEGRHEQSRQLHIEEITLGQELKDKRMIAWGLEALSGEASGRGQAGCPREAWVRAARLMGAAEALFAPFPLLLPPPRRAIHDQTVDAARAALGEEAFAAAWAEGRAMTLQQAIEYALQEVPDA